MANVHKTCPTCGQPASLKAPSCLSCGHVYRTRFADLDERTQLTELPHSQHPLPPASPQCYKPPPYRASVQYQPAQKLDTCAVLSLVFGVMAWVVFCFGWIFAIPAAALGVASLVRMRNDPSLTGKEFAIAGLSLC